MKAYPQSKKRQAPVTQRFEVRPPPRSYGTRSTSLVATDSPPVMVYCHGSELKKQKKDCRLRSTCTKNFCNDSLVEKFHYVAANIKNINFEEWVCPSCTRGCTRDCGCNDCEGKLIIDDFLDEPSPPPPSQALDEVADRLVGRLRKYRQVFEEGLADIRDQSEYAELIRGDFKEEEEEEMRQTNQECEMRDYKKELKKGIKIIDKLLEKFDQHKKGL